MFVEVHVDFLPDNGSVETFDGLREAIDARQGGSYSVRFATAASADSQFNHPKGICKCKKQVHHIGQDESVYEAYAREGNE